eukprot:gene8196-1464_t
MAEEASSIAQAAVQKDAAGDHSEALDLYFKACSALLEAAEKMPAGPHKMQVQRKVECPPPSTAAPQSLPARKVSEYLNRTEVLKQTLTPASQHAPLHQAVALPITPSPSPFPQPVPVPPVPAPAVPGPSTSSDGPSLSLADDDWVLPPEQLQQQPSHRFQDPTALGQSTYPMPVPAPSLFPTPGVDPPAAPAAATPGPDLSRTSSKPPIPAPSPSPCPSPAPALAN